MNNGSSIITLLAWVSAFLTSAAEQSVLSDGRMLVSVNPDASITQIHWPHVGAYGQLDETSHPRWGVLIDDAVLWLDDDGWSHDAILRDESARRLSATYHHEDPALEVTTMVELEGGGDRVQMSIAITGMDTAKVVWDSGFALSASVAPETAGNHSALPFVAGTIGDSKGIVYARPLAIGRDSFAKLEKRTPWSSEDWRSLGTGVWLGVTSPQLARERGVYAGGESSDTLQAFGYGHMRSRLVIEAARAEDSLQAQVVLTFAPRFHELVGAMNADFKPIPPQPVPRPRQFGSAHAHIQDAAELLVASLIRFQDSTSGAIISGASSNTASTPVDIVSAAQALYALSMSNRKDESAALAAYLAQQIMLTPESPRPLGSAYRFMHVTGEPATPHYEVELLPAAAILWAITEYAEDFDARKRVEYLRTMRDPLEFAADFLEAWSRPLLDRAAQLDDAEEGAVYLRDIASAHVGLQAASRMFGTLGLEVPETWTLAINRARRVLSERGIYAFTPWDVQAIPNGGHLSLRALADEGDLSAYLNGLESTESRLNALLSAGYQLRRNADGVQLPRSLIGDTADKTLKPEDLDTDPEQTAYIARLLAILFQSYQSRP